MSTSSVPPGATCGAAKERTALCPDAPDGAGHHPAASAKTATASAAIAGFNIGLVNLLSVGAERFARRFHSHPQGIGKLGGSILKIL